MIIITRKQPAAKFRVIYKVVIEMTITLWAVLRTVAVTIGALGTNTTLTRLTGTVGLPAAGSIDVNQSRAWRRKYGRADLLRTVLRTVAVTIGAPGTNTTLTRLTAIRQDS